MFFRYLTVFLVLSISFQSTAQVSKWGKVSQRELELDSVEFESDANAVVLFNTGKLYFVQGSGHNIEIRKRIKILSEEGIKEANREVYFYSYDGFEDIIRFKAQTINTDSEGNIETLKVEKTSTFKTEVTDRFSSFKWTFPDVKIGSIIEYTYTLKSEGITTIDAWRFQEEIPTLYSKLETEIPNALAYKILFQGPRLIRKYGTGPNQSQWELKNIPSIKPDEPFLLNHNDYYEKVRLQLEEYYGSGTVQKVSGGWEDFAHTLYKHSRFNEYNTTRKAKIREELEAIALPSDHLGKVKELFNYVTSNYDWNRRYGLIPNERFVDYFKNRKGNSSSLNLHLRGLLREAEIPSDIIVISTISNGLTFKQSPFFTDFNHLILRVPINGKYYFLDATSQGRLPFGMLPLQSNVKEGVLTERDNAEWIKISNAKKKMDVVFASFYFDSTGYLTKDISWLLKDYSAESLRKYIVRNDSSKLSEKVCNVSNYELSKYSDINLLDAEKPLKVNLVLKDTEEPISESDILYVNTNLEPDLEENPFKRDERNFPIQFEITPFLNQTVTLQIPDGFKVDELPTSIALTLPNKEAKFEFRCKEVGDKILISTSYQVLQNEIKPRYFHDFRLFYTKMIEKVNEPIVLTRIN